MDERYPPKSSKVKAYIQRKIHVYVREYKCLFGAQDNFGIHNIAFLDG